MVDQAPYETTDLAPDSDSPMDWSKMRDQLAAPPPPDTPGGHFPAYLGTVRPNGLPHATGVAARWYDGDMYFTSGAGSRKSRNLAENPACTLSMHVNDADLILEGDARPCDDPDTVAAYGELMRNAGWPVEVVEGGYDAPFSAPDAGPPPWRLYRLVFHTAIMHGDGATRWRFAR
jgi:hypothetical protein